MEHRNSLFQQRDHPRKSMTLEPSCSAQLRKLRVYTGFETG